MPTYLVAIDTSPAAADVLAAAQELALLTHARLLLCRAIGLLVEPPETQAISPAGITNMLFATARKSLMAKAVELPSALEVETLVEIGPAWRVICEGAKMRDVDLIIIGAHGHRFLDRVLGTTTQQVVAHADRAVLVVRPNPHAADLQALNRPLQHRARAAD